MSSSTLRDFLTPGAGATPAEGSVKPTAGFTFNKVIYPSRFYIVSETPGMNSGSIA